MKTTQTDAATPRPWAATVGNGIIAEIGGVKVDVADCETWPRNIQTDIANAALIVRAVNLMAAHEAAAKALQMMRDHYEDLQKSNPGFMGKLYLQNYGLWNKALLNMDSALSKLKEENK